MKASFKIIKIICIVNDHFHDKYEYEFWDNFENNLINVYLYLKNIECWNIIRINWFHDCSTSHS